MQFGHSKDHRPDLRQFKQVLGTLDPVGLPLATATVSGEQADDPHYIPIWRRLVAVIGHADFLTVGDCKLASLANRAQIQAGGGFYLAPLPATGHTPRVSPRPFACPTSPARSPPWGTALRSTCSATGRTRTARTARTA